jgi:hypothetical protein
MVGVRSALAALIRKLQPRGRIIIEEYLTGASGKGSDDVHVFFMEGYACWIVDPQQEDETLEVMKRSSTLAELTFVTSVPVALPSQKETAGEDAINTMDKWAGAATLVAVTAFDGDGYIIGELLPRDS